MEDRNEVRMTSEFPEADRDLGRAVVLEGLIEFRNRLLAFRLLAVAVVAVNLSQVHLVYFKA